MCGSAVGAETYDPALCDSDALGSCLVLRLHGFSVHNRTAGSYGALSTTAQLKGFNLDVIPAPVRGVQGKPSGVLLLDDHVVFRAHLG